MPFAATRDPRFIQGRALVKAKKYEAAIDCSGTCERSALRYGVLFRDDR